MRQRFEALGMMVKWKNMMEKQIGGKINELQIGNVKKNTRTNSYNLARTLVLALTSQIEYMGWLRKSTAPCWRRFGICCLMHD